MKDSATLIVAQDCAAYPLTVGGFAMLLSVDSPYVSPNAEREPTVVDALFAHHILSGNLSATLAEGYLGELAEEADGLDLDTAAEIHAAVQMALNPFTLALKGMGGDSSGKNKGGDVGPPSNGIVPALLLRCAKEFGWTVKETLATPIGTLFILLREELVQKGKAISYYQMDIIDRLVMQNSKAKP